MVWVLNCPGPMVYRPIALGDERFALDLGGGRLRRARRIEERHELLDVRGGVMLARKVRRPTMRAKRDGSRLSHAGRNRRRRALASVRRDHVGLAHASGTAPSRRNLYEMTFAIGLTTRLRLMSPMNLTIIFPEPIVPGSGWASGNPLDRERPGPLGEFLRCGVGARACVIVVRPGQMCWQRERVRAGAGSAVQVEDERTSRLEQVLGEQAGDACHLVGIRVSRRGRGRRIGRREEHHVELPLEELIGAAGDGVGMDRAGSIREPRRPHGVLADPRGGEYLALELARSGVIGVGELGP